MDYFNAFWTGGLICALVQILLDKTKLLPGRVMVLLVCSGHTLWKGMQKAISEDGFLGLFTGGFTACALGVSAALIFSYLSSMIFHPQMKD